MDLPASDAQSSSRSFFLFLCSAPDSCCLFEAIFEKFTHTPFPPKPGRCWFRAGSNSGTSSSVFHTKKAGSGSKKQVRSQHQLLDGPETRTGDVGFVPRLWAELPHQKQTFSPPFFSTVNQEDEWKR